jgi:hypothetical protein
VAKAVVRVRLHTTLDHQLSDIKKLKEQLQLLTASIESVIGLFQQQTLKHPISAQLHKKLYQCYITMHSKGKPMTGPVITKATSFYGEMKITDMCKFCVGWL